MSPSRPRVEIFGCVLEVLDREGDRFLVRARLKAPGLAGGAGTVVHRQELEDLLDQVERQYADLDGVVSWETGASPTVRVGWRIDKRGHLVGRAELRDRAEGWAATVRIRADQSYLPRVALGLRLLLR